MASASLSWEPANDVERALRDAWLRNDSGAFLRTIATAPLYLPGFANRDVAQRLLTWPHDGRTHLLAFTSPEAMYQQLTGIVDGWRMTSMAELTRSRADPAWGVAVSPNTPIGACLSPDELDAIAEVLDEELMFRPATLAEAAMFRAKQEATPSDYLDALVLSSVFLPLAAAAGASDLARPDFPWLIEGAETPTIPVFTSDLRLAEAVSDQTPTALVELVALARAWPDRSVRMVVNPGTAIDATFTGDQVADLIDWAGGLMVREGFVAAHVDVDTPVPEPTGSEMITVEVIVSADDVELFLNGTYDRVVGARPPLTPAPAGAHVIRWRQPTANNDTPGSLVDGAQLLRIDPGGERRIATYQADLRRWLPTVADLLRGSALS